MHWRRSKDRTCCILANHGMIATGPTLAKAQWLAVELETIAKQYYLTLCIGGPVVLPDDEIDRVKERFKSYGPRPKAEPPTRTRRPSARRRRAEAARAGRPLRGRRRRQRRRHCARRRRPRPQVLLCEKDDLAQGTSSRSGKLVHGGLRYLEYYEFRLVREALIEREVLLRGGAAHHLADALRAAAQSPGMRPAWLVRLGLFLYDHLGGRKRLPRTRALDLRRDPKGAPLKPEYTQAASNIPTAGSTMRGWWC